MATKTNPNNRNITGGVWPEIVVHDNKVVHNASLSGEGTTHSPLSVSSIFPSYNSTAAAQSALGTGVASFFTVSGCLYWKKPGATTIYTIACS